MNAHRALLVVLSLWCISADANTFDYCILCHGTEGNGNAAIGAPKISGMEPWYIARQLEAFAAGVRGAHADDDSGQEMRAVGLRLKEEQAVDDAIQFVSTLKPAMPVRTVKGDVQRGRSLFVACAACHGEKGEGNHTLQAPALAARSDWYLVTQLEKFRRGERGSDERDLHGARMRAAIAMLPDAQATADVVAFINTLQ